MRKKFVLFALIPALLLGVVTYLFAERWIESGLEAAGEALVGAKVEIDNLQLSLSPLGAEFARLQVANRRDPWKNIFETGRVKFVVDFGQLLRGKYIIETMELNDLVIGSKRTTDGSLPKKPEPPKPAATETPEAPFAEQAKTVLATQAKKTPIFDLSRLKKEFKIDSLLNVQNLASVRHYDSLKQQVREASEQWQTTAKEFEQSKQRLAEVEATIKSINPNELKTIEAITTTITKVNNSYKTINELNETFKSQRSSLTADINRLSASLKSIDDIVKRDYESLLGLARLPDVNMQGLAEVLLGKDLMQQAQEYLYWVDFAKTTVPQYLPRPEKEKPKPFEGQDIHFPEERSYPKFWIKKILVSGSEDQQQKSEYFYAKGEILNISSNQRQTGKPLTVALAAARADRTSFTFDAVFDRRPEIPVDQYTVRVKNIAIGQLSLGRSDFLPSRIINAKGEADVDVNVPGSAFEANTAMVFTGVTVVFEQNPRNDVERIARDVLAGIKAFSVKLRLWNTAGKFDVALATDLDDQIASRAKQVIGAEIARLQNEVRTKLNQKIAEKRQEFEKLYNEKREEVLARIRQHENLVNEKIAMVESKRKELEARLEQEKKKQVESVTKKAEDALKGLIKRKQ